MTAAPLFWCTRVPSPLFFKRSSSTAPTTAALITAAGGGDGGPGSSWNSAPSLLTASVGGGLPGHTRAATASRKTSDARPMAPSTGSTNGGSACNGGERLGLLAGPGGGAAGLVATARRRGDGDMPQQRMKRTVTPRGGYRHETRSERRALEGEGEGQSREAGGPPMMAVSRSRRRGQDCEVKDARAIVGCIDSPICESVQ